MRDLYPLVVIGGLIIAGLVAYVAYLVGDKRRRKGGAGRPMLRSIQEGITRAKRGRRRVLVAFVEREHAGSKALFDHLALAPELDATLRGIEIVKVEVLADDREVAAALARKYGLPSLAVPTLLALDEKGQKVGALEGAAAEPTKVEDFVKSIRP
ncbi:MAG: hypothetical protein ACAI25_18505 [Planctomycetota bacterium]